MAKQTNLHDEIHKFIVFFSFVGLWPTSSNSKFKVFLVICSIFYISVVFCMFWSAFHSNHQLVHNTLSAIVQSSFLASILIAHFTVILEALINRNGQVRLIERISHTDWLLRSKLQLIVSYGREKHAIFTRFGIFILILVLIRTILTCYLNIEYHINDFWFQCTFSTWILRLRFIQVIFLVYLLRIRLCLVRKKLKEVLVTCNLYVKRKNRWRLYHDTSKIFVLDMATAKRSLYDRLLSLKQVYGELHEICEFINILFGWSMFTIIAQSFFELSGSSYWIYLALEKSDYSLASDCLCLLAPIIVLLSTMVYFCSSCSRCVSSIKYFERKNVYEK